MSSENRKNSNALQDKIVLPIQNLKIFNLITNSNLSTKEQNIIIDYINSLENRDAILCALEAGGVDNWEWYGESIKDFFRKEEEEF